MDYLDFCVDVTRAMNREIEKELRKDGHKNFILMGFLGAGYFIEAEAKSIRLVIRGYGALRRTFTNPHNLNH